jgi:hypothetical protein
VQEQFRDTFPVWIKLAPHVRDRFAGEELEEEEKHGLDHNDYYYGVDGVSGVDEYSFVHDAEESDAECDLDETS